MHERLESEVLHKVRYMQLPFAGGMPAELRYDALHRITESLRTVMMETTRKMLTHTHTLPIW